MLQRAASNACSWWWASHIRTKQSKWLDTDIQEMEERVKCMLKIVEQDGDSFAKKAEMYFKKRPELIHFVEETYKAYKALADRYDHISSELHKANHTLATAFPDQIQFDMQDDDDDNLPKAFTSIDPSKIRKPSTDIPPISLMSKKKENHTLKKSRLARVASQKSIDKAQEEIDKLQKGILVLQTEKEYVKSTYENGIAKYWNIEKQITEMQEDVFSLQDEFSASMVIDDDEARALMAVTALKSCENSLAKLEEQQKQSMDETRIESDRIQAAKEKMVSAKGKSGEITEINMEEEVLGPREENLDSQSLCDVVKEYIEISSETSVVELAEKINELVTKVIEMELTASSQTAQIKSLRLESELLHRNLRCFEEEKQTLIDESNSLRDKLKKAEENLQRELDFKQHAPDKSSVVDDISVKVMSPKHQDKVNIISPSQKVSYLYNTAQKEGKDTPELEEYDKAEKFNSEKNSTETCHSLGGGSEISMALENQEDVKVAGLSQVEMTQRKSENKEVVEGLDAANNIAEKQDDGTSSPQADYNAHSNKESSPQSEKYFDHSEANSQLKNDPVKSQTLIQEVNLGSSQADDHVHPSTESKAQPEKMFDNSEVSFQIKDDSATSHFPEWEVNFSSSLENDYCHPSNKAKPQLGNPFDLLEADSQIIGDAIKSQVTKYEFDIGSLQADGNIHPGNEFNPQLEICFDHFKAVSQLKDDSVQTHVTKQGVGSFEGNINIHRSKESMQQQQPEDQEVSLDWLRSLVDGVEGKEKIILAEYTSILRSYKDVKKRLSEVEMKNQEYALETAMKDKEIHSLQQILISLQSNSDNNWDKKGSNLQKTEALGATARKYTSFNVAEMKLAATDGRNATSAIEEKFRRDIDTVLEENLEFWLRFSTSFHSIQKFQTTFEELQAEFKKLKHRKLGESSSQSETLPVDKKLRELKTELHVWLEQNTLLQGELGGKFSSLSSIQEEISGTLEASLEASLEADVVKFAPYQAAKFQGELLNMQLENNKVAEELKAGIDHVSGLQAEVEKSLSKLHKKFELPQPGKSSHDQLSHASTKNRVPLKSFLFNAKPKKMQSLFARVNPALQKHSANRPS